MAVLGGGIWGGINQGLKDLDQAAIDRKKMDVMDSEMGVRKEQLGMQKDLHGIKMDENKRDNEIIKIADIQKNFGDKNPSAFTYGVDHATRNGFIQTDPTTGEQGIRRKDLNQTMAHLDTATGVDEISKRDIALYSDKLRAAKDPAEIAELTEKLNQAKLYNKGALKALEIQMRSEDKELDRQNRLELRAMMAGRGGGGGNGLTRGEKLEEKATNRLDKYESQWQKGIDAAKKQYDKDLDEKGVKAATENWNANVVPLREHWGPKIRTIERQLGIEGPPAKATPRLGGGGQTAPSKVAVPTATQKKQYGNSQGLTMADLVRPLQDAGITSLSQGADILVNNFGYKPDQAADIMREINKGGYFK